MRFAAGSTGPVAKLGPGRATSGPDPPTGARDPVDRLGEQPGVGRIGDVGRDDSGVDPDLRRAQHLRLDRLRQQGLVQPVDRGRSRSGW